MQIDQHKSLKRLNTFGIAVQAQYYAACSSLNDIRQAINFTKENALNLLTLGGGSNLLFTKDFNGLVLHNKLKGIETTEQDDHYLIKAAAGEVWHDLVMYCVERNMGGIENLSLIPGSCGAAPIQNIGAYGVEIKDVLEKVHYIDIDTLEEQSLVAEDCKFGYRDSIFKGELKGKIIVTSIELKLSKANKLSTSYGSIKNELKAQKLEPSIQNISKAVCAIRRSKLPDPEKIGNAGSFFKNPIVSATRYKMLNLNYPDMPAYVLDGGEVKLAAGWLIEKAGWKGKTLNECGVHNKQALVLVNHSNAEGKDIYRLSEQIIKDIQLKFNIELEREVNCI